MLGKWLLGYTNCPRGPVNRQILLLLILSVYPETKRHSIKDVFEAD